MQETIIQLFNTYIRPFSKTAEIGCRDYSLPLQRVMTDFGAEKSFSRAAAGIKEHYGIEVPISAITAITEKHAKQMFDKQELRDEIPDSQGVDIIVAETDGSMVPIVDVNASQCGDKRKTRSIRWKEAPSLSPLLTNKQFFSKI